MNADKVIKFLDKETFTGKIIQIIIGFILTVGVYFIARFVVKMDKFDVHDTAKAEKTQTDIIKGSAESSALAVLSYNTVLKFSSSYKRINPSINIKGGSQFSYCFWINLKNIGETDVQNKLIFLKGDKQKYSFKTIDNTTDNTTVVAYDDYVVLCPAFGFGDSSADFIVKFNTSNNIHEQLTANTVVSNDKILQNNVLSTLRNDWVMFTIVFEDNIKLTDFENGIKVRLYLNDFLYKTSDYNGMLKQNSGNLYFFPEGAITGVKLANMTYFNHAIGINEITQLYNKKPNAKSANLASETHNAVINSL